MGRIKILRIIARLNIGGPAIHTILLTEGLDKDRFDSLLICGMISKDEGDLSYYAFEKNIKPIFIPELKRELNFLNDVVAFKKIYKIIKTEHPGIIHTHTAKAGALGRLAGIIYNFFLTPKKPIKLVHTFHGHIFGGYFNKFKTRLFILIERFLASFTCKIITVSESTKDEIVSLRICPENKIQVIPLGFELEKFLNILPKDNTAFFNIGIIGRLVSIKNHRLFLEAAANIIRISPQTRMRFKIIGDGELREELKGYAQKLDINNWVDFVGWQKDLVKVYSELDIVALTSINEGTPVSLIEAMASGRAVVATDIGGISELLGAQIATNIKSNANFKVLERGIIVKSGDAIGFAKALICIAEHNDLRQDIGRRSRKFVKDIFTKERLIKDITNLYNNLIYRP